MKQLHYRLAAVCLLGALASPALAEKKPQLSGLELQQMQSRDFEVGVDVTFPAVMSVLQDAGYRLLSADRDTGLITGQGSSNSKTTYNLFWGFGNKKRSPVVSAFIEKRGQHMSRIRLSFVMAVTKGGIYGTRAADEEPITDPAIYQDAFEKINQAVFIRQAMDAPPVAPAAPTVAPVASASSQTESSGQATVTPVSTPLPSSK